VTTFHFELPDIVHNQKGEPSMIEFPVSQSKERPVHQIRYGTIKAAIWRSDTAPGVWFNTTFARLYKDPVTDQWRTSDSFGRDDLLLLAKVADAVHTWICEQGESKTPESQN